MRLLLLALLVFSAVLQLPAQSFSILDSNNNDVTNIGIKIPVMVNSSNKHVFKIKNNTNADITYRVERTYLTTPYCSDSYIFYCAAGLCLPPDSMITQTTLNATILANQTLPSGPNTYGIEAHYDIGTICCDEDVLYKVINVSDSTDTATVILKYGCVVGINENVSNSMLQLYPNPTSDYLYIKRNAETYCGSLKIVLIDALGKVVKNINLKEPNFPERISISDMESGIYFYSIYCGDSIVNTKKIIISNKRE